MRKLILMTAIAFASMAATPATTATGTVGDATGAGQMAQAAPAAGQSNSAPVAQAPAVEEKKICKLLPSSGTRFTKRACLTDKEWKQVEAGVDGDNGY
jgi:hypothetical protein